jgi:CRISPR-associated protein (TIGR03986 family)
MSDDADNNMRSEAAPARRWYDPQNSGMGVEYRFVPLASHVLPAPVQLEGQPALSHARPVPGGFSGQITLDLVAETPVLFGKVGEDEVVRPARLWDGNGPFVMPGSAVRGMLRGVYRIATFSALSPVNKDHIFANRSPDYLEYLLNNGDFGEVDSKPPPRPGWLQASGNAHDGFTWTITPASGEPAALCYSVLAPMIVDDSAVEEFHKQKLRKRNRLGELRDLLATLRDRLTGKYTAQSRVSVWRDLTVSARHSLVTRNFNQLQQLVPAGHYLHLTGPMPTKSSENLFPDPDPTAEALPVPKRVMDAFLMAASTYSKAGADYPMGGRRSLRDDSFRLAVLGWKGRPPGLLASLGVMDGADWREDNPPGIPVFYYESTQMRRGDGEEQGPPSIVAFGAPELFRIGHKHSVGAVLGRKPAALASGVLDWSDALFGRVSERQQQAAEEGDDAAPRAGGPPNTGNLPSLKSRLRFHFAKAEGATPLCEIKVVQGAPKASYDPFYLSRMKLDLYEQKADDRGEDRRELVQATWDSANAELNGHKRYPACMTASNSYRGNATDAQANMANTVQPLESGCTFKVVIDFHNLHPLELGAVLWSLCFGDRSVLAGSGETSRYRHVAGRLRNKGFGRLRPASLRLAALRQNPMPQELRIETVTTCASEQADLLMRAFEVSMDAELEQREGTGFYASDQISALCNLADSEWAGDGTTQHNKDQMFRLPVKENGQTEFSRFTALRKHLFMGSSPYDGEIKTVLSEFLKPKANPPEVLAERRLATALDPLRDPVAALAAWRRHIRPVG